MPLEQLEMETGLNKEDYAIQLLQTWVQNNPAYLGFSGGVDSQIIYDLAKRAKIPFDAHYCVSPIDPPQVRKFIKEHYPDVIWDYHAKGFWKTVVSKGLPMRNQRWCCAIIKEAGGDGRICIFGNRADESSTRKHQCYVSTPEQIVISKHTKKMNKTIIRPILKFTNYDRWQYMLKYKLPHCELYDMGYHRVGCVLCPYSNDIEQQEKDFPEVVKLWKLSCSHLVEEMKARGYLSKRGKPLKHKFQNGEEMYKWWTKRKAKKRR